MQARLFPLLLACLYSISLSSSIISTIVGSTFGYSGDGGPASSAHLQSVSSVVLDHSGNIYITDFEANVIRRVDALTSIITTIAGDSVNGNPGYSGDGGPANSSFLNNPLGLALDPSGTFLYVADQNNGVIRLISLNSSPPIITTVAGNFDMSGSYSGDGGLAVNAGLSLPTAIALDAALNLYIADFRNDVIRKVNTVTGIISTVVGTPGTGGPIGDGLSATAAKLNRPTGLVVDKFGNLIIADTFNFRIRMVNATTNIITTIAGDGVASSGGNGGPATSTAIHFPSSPVFDKFGSLYFIDSGSVLASRVRIISRDGTIDDVAGENGPITSIGDGGPATQAEFLAFSIAVDCAQNIYIADGDTILNHFAIRLVDSGLSVPVSRPNIPPGQYIANICDGRLILSNCTGPIPGKNYVSKVCQQGSELQAGSDTVLLQCTTPTPPAFILAPCIPGNISSLGSDAVILPGIPVTQDQVIADLNNVEGNFTREVNAVEALMISLQRETIMQLEAKLDTDLNQLELSLSTNLQTSLTSIVSQLESFIANQGCPAGLVRANAGSSCLPCPPGSVSNSGGNSGGTGCILCNAGTKSYSDGTSCHPCGPGYFSPSAGSSTCAPCPAGSVSPNEASACTPCVPGSYSSSPGSTACTLCPSGFYCPGGSAQYECPNHDPHSVTGSSSSSDCYKNGSPGRMLLRVDNGSTIIPSNGEQEN